MFPKIDRPCPYADRLASVMDCDFCRMCKRTVTDLDAMEAGERRAFLSECAEEVCVTYKLPIRPALAAAALAAAVAALPAAAQDMPAGQEAVAPDTDPAHEIVVTGGIGPRSPLTLLQPVTLVTAQETPKERRRERGARLKKRALDRVEID